MNNYYEHSDLKRIPELVQLAQRQATSFFSFENEVYHGSKKIPLITKELIAIAVAHVVGCPYCIDVHVKKYRDLGGTLDELTEAIFVATSTRAGAILSHATQALKAFENFENSSEKPQKSVNTSEPECFC